MRLWRMFKGDGSVTHEEVEKANDKSVWRDGWRVNRNGGSASWHDTQDEALKAALTWLKGRLSDVNTEIEALENRKGMIEQTITDTVRALRDLTGEPVAGIRCIKPCGKNERVMHFNFKNCSFALLRWIEDDGEADLFEVEGDPDDDCYISLSEFPTDIFPEAELKGCEVPEELIGMIRDAWLEKCGGLVITADAPVYSDITIYFA